ncbi:MAG: iron(III) transport system substrate-binding protein [Paracoccaceae bacterium]|jgi:iron(III) transport system substrate-binding protein
MKTTTCTVSLLGCLAISAPTQAQEVNVYSYRQPELVKPLFDAFTDETGIKINVAFLQKGMVEKLKAEGDRTPADLIFTVDVSRLNAVVAAGLTQAVSSDILNANIPANFRDPENHWFGLTSRARIIYASNERVEDGEISTYEDLADPKWLGRICTRSGTHAYTLALVSAYLAHHDLEETAAWLRGVKANLARKPQGNDRAQVKAVWSGECDVALGNTYYMGKMLGNDEQKAWANSVRIVFPVFEGDGTHLNLTGVAMTKSAPHAEDALKLMEFLSSAKAQEIYAEANFEYPLRAGTTPSALVKSWGSFDADSLNLMDVAKLRPVSLRLVEEVDFDG